MRIAVTRVFSCIAVLCVIFSSTGCASKPKAVPYSFAEGYDETAEVKFETGGKYSVSFRTFEGERLPEPAPGTVWAPEITFPAGRPLITLIHVYFDGRDHFFWTGAIFSGVGSVSGEGAIGLLFLLGFTLARDILWSPVVFVDMATADSQKTNRDVIFIMPALENGRKYKVWFKRRGKKYTLYLTDTGSGRVIYEQEFDRIEEKWERE